jgi:NAD(P)H-dependent FMN reductase
MQDALKRDRSYNPDMTNTPDTAKLKLHIIVASTRPGRVGAAVAKWFQEFAVSVAQFDVRLVDLAEINLPLLDEPVHPKARQYQHQHTKDWSALVQSADAYVIVTPEYNFSAPPALVNALNYVYLEWNYKPVGFVSYGGISGGLRSVQMTKQIVTTLKMMPIMEAVAIPFVNQYLNEAGAFVAKEFHQKTGQELLSELHKWAVALKPMRG